MFLGNPFLGVIRKLGGFHGIQKMGKAVLVFILGSHYIMLASAAIGPDVMGCSSISRTEF